MPIRPLLPSLLATLIAFHLSAEIIPEMHIPVESRPLTHAQRMEIIEEHASEAASGCFQFSKETAVGSFETSTNYSSAHPGASHWAVEISPNGEQIITEDGSIWATYPGDRYKAIRWNSADDLVVIQNTDPFSNYMFTLVNTSVKKGDEQKVHINLVLGPLYDGKHTFWIKAINAADRKIILNDNSIWDMSRFDSSVYRMWFVNDTIIIGINDGSLNSFNPNILINVNTLTYARASLD